MANKYLFIGGLVAVGFDATGDYLLAISHSGRGVYSVKSWERIARDVQPAYPIGGYGDGIGPIAGQAVPVSNLDSDHPICINAPDGCFELRCTSDAIEIVPAPQL
jgi:hypothetical protein